MHTRAFSAITCAAVAVTLLTGTGAAHAEPDPTAAVHSGPDTEQSHEHEYSHEEELEQLLSPAISSTAPVETDHAASDALVDEVALFGVKFDNRETGDGLDLTVEDTNPVPDTIRTAASVPLSVRTVDRASGSDRFESSVQMSRQGYPDGAPVVYIASGESFPDALSAGAAAAKENGPLLLTRNEFLPDTVRNEINRLRPQRIVVAGGPVSISETVVSSLKAMKPTVRIYGADRYETSVRVSNHAFGRGSSTTAYLATGVNFPDALSAGGAAGSINAPVILVHGPGTGVGNLTISSLKNMGVKTVKIAGSSNVISRDIEDQFTRNFANVTRIAGADRFATSERINADAFTRTGGRVFIATGHEFPDALSGSAYAGGHGAPLFVSRTDCVPHEILTAIENLKPYRITLLGGANTLSTGVAQMTPCPQASVAISNYIFPTVVRNVSDDFDEHIARGSVNPGTDYTTYIGQTVVAVKSGRVTYAQSTYAGSGGRLVYLRHDDGTYTDYLHFSRVDVRTGDYVSQGQRLGLSGASAWGLERGVGAHLHISLKIGGRNVDFERYVS